MSWISSVLVAQLERELIAMEPEIAHYILEQVQEIGSHIMTWIDKKGYHAASADPRHAEEE